MVSTGTMYMAMLQFSWLGIANSFYMASEKEVDACHRVIEIELHIFIANMSYHALHAVALWVLEWQNIANFKQAIRYCAFMFKNLLWNFYQRGRVVFAIGFGGQDAKSEGITDGKSSQICFKSRDHHAYTIDKSEWFASVGRFDELSFGSALIKIIVYGHYFV